MDVYDVTSAQPFCMSVPLSLRVCCMAVMAPALTEAASQSCIKLSPASPPVSPQLPAIGGVTNGNSGQLKSKPFVGLTSHITLGELKRLQQKGLLKNIGCQEIKFKVVANSEETVAKDKLVFMQHQNRNYSESGCENMNQTNHVNGNDNVGTKLKSNNGLKVNTPIKNTDNKIPVESIGIVSTNSEEDCLNKSESGPSMVASSSELDTVNNAEQTTSVETNVNIQSAIDKSLQEQVKSKQHVLENRTQHLLRRLRRLQSKNVEVHLHTQLRNFVGYQHKNLQTVAKSIKNTASTNNINEVKTELFSSDDVKSLSTAALVNLVRRLQSSQPSLSLSQRLINSSRSDNGPTGVLKIDKPTAEESIRVSGLLSSNLHHMQNCVDSDATESSSGGESCDEDDPSYSKKSRSTSL